MLTIFVDTLYNTHFKSIKKQLFYSMYLLDLATNRSGIGSSELNGHSIGVLQETTSIVEHGTNDEPRAIKKRSKKIRSDRRSKSLEHRRNKRVALHSSIPKSKDDLDRGVFTLVGKPPNLWDQENSLKRGKSLPNLGSNGLSNGFSISTPDLNDHLTNKNHVQSPQQTELLTEHPTTGYDGDDVEIKTKSTKHTIYIQTSGHEVSSVSESPCVDLTNSSVKINFGPLEQKQRVVIPTPTEPIASPAAETPIEQTNNSVEVANEARNAESFTKTELNIGELKRSFKECVVTIRSSVSEETGQQENELILATQTTDLQHAEELKSNFEQLLQMLDNVTEDFKLESSSTTAPPPRMQPATSSATPFTTLRETQIVEQHHIYHYPQPQLIERRQITFQQQLYNDSVIDLFGYSITMFRDLLQQLVPSPKDQNNNNNSENESDEPAQGFRTMIGNYQNLVVIRVEAKIL